ncbi:hypothetical protein IV203_024196 [Nitzschia inconspicua]|uniref:Uncharacterized protein n=1 Tax=Nitzschia inconspicua TaxID=303405 RepID=A0A9K3KCX5_9STRA|nr:hypothetical protein IV203_024196 [Nitzschia inconspicua]
MSLHSSRSYNLNSKPAGCGYHHGAFPTLVAQFLLFCGFWFSVAVMGDCSFVEVAEPIQVRQDGALATRLGLLSYTEMGTGQCYFWTDTLPRGTVPGKYSPVYGEQQFEYYMQEVLGSQWYLTIGLSATAVGISLVCFVYVTTYCCSTQVHAIRLFSGLMVALIFVTVQGLTFLVLSTDWCVDNQCETSRTTGFSFASIVSFFLSGCAFLFMTDYPGKEALAKLQGEQHKHLFDEDDEGPPNKILAGGLEELDEASPEEEEEDDDDEEEGLLPADQNIENQEEGIQKSMTIQESEDPEAAPEKHKDTIAQTDSSTAGSTDADAKSKNTETITVDAVPVSDSS